MSTISADAAYNERTRARFPMNLSTASRSLGVSIQRLSRYLKALEIPVSRHGYAVLIEANSYSRVKRALKINAVKRGRKKKAS
jgi:hypothetical protein